MCVCVCHIFFIHSSINGHPGCVYVLATVKNAAGNIGMHYLIELWFSLNIYPGSELQDTMIALFLFFYGATILLWLRLGSDLKVCLEKGLFALFNNTRHPLPLDTLYSPLENECISTPLYFSHKIPNVCDVLVWDVTQTLCSLTWKASTHPWNPPSLSYSSKPETSFILRRKSYLHSP